jgi:hypothetical protein
MQEILENKIDHLKKEHKRLIAACKYDEAQMVIINLNDAQKKLDDFLILNNHKYNKP